MRYPNELSLRSGRQRIKQMRCRPRRGLKCFSTIWSWGLRPRLYAFARSAGLSDGPKFSSRFLRDALLPETLDQLLYQLNVSRVGLDLQERFQLISRFFISLHLIVEQRELPVSIGQL